MKKQIQAYMPLAIGLVIQFAVLALILMGDPHTLTAHNNPIGNSATESLAQTLQSSAVFAGMNK